MCFAWLSTLDTHMCTHIAKKLTKIQPSRIQWIVCVSECAWNTMEPKNGMVIFKKYSIKIHTYEKQVMQSMMNSPIFSLRGKISFDGMSTLNNNQLINIHSSVILLSIKFTKRKQARKKSKEK